MSVGVSLIVPERTAESMHKDLIIPDFNLKDSIEQTPFALALWNGYHQLASHLLLGGASINDTNSDGMTLLHQAIMKQDAISAVYLLDHGADLKLR